MKIADCRDKEKFIELFREYEPIRAGWLQQSPLSVAGLEELAVGFLNQGKIVLDTDGFVIFSNDPGNVGHIDHLYVRKNSRRQGIGKKLISDAEKLLKEKGCSLVTLVNSVFNRSINGFYMNLGYSYKGESRYYHLFEKKI